MDALPPLPPAEPRQRWRLVYARSRAAATAGARDQLAAWEAAVVATRLPAVGLDGEPARPRIVLAVPIPVGLVAERELADLYLTARMPIAEVRDALAANLPPEHDLVDLCDVWLGEPALPGQVIGADYRGRVVAEGARPIDAPVLAEAADGILSSTTLRRTRRKGDRDVAYDLRPLLLGIDVRESTRSAGQPGAVQSGVRTDGVMVRIRVRHDPERGVGRPEEVLAALAERMGVQLAFADLVRERIVLAGDD